MKIGLISRHEDTVASRAIIHAIRVSRHEPIIINPEKKLRPVVDALIVRFSPASEQDVIGVCTYYEKLGVPMTTTGGAIEIASDKEKTALALQKLGLPIPVTTSVDEATVETALAKHSFPLIVKISGSSQGKGVIVAESLRSARSIIDALFALQQKVLIQEYIDAKAEDIRILVVNGRIIAAMKRIGQNKDEFRANISAGGRGQAYTPTEEEARLALAACRAVDSAVAGVDIIVDAARGPLLLEINVSPGLAIQGVTGINIPASYIEFLEHSTAMQN